MKYGVELYSTETGEVFDYDEVKSINEVRKSARKFIPELTPGRAIRAYPLEINPTR